LIVIGLEGEGRGGGDAPFYVVVFRNLTPMFKSLR